MLFYAIFDIAKEVKTYTDLTGRFSNRSSRRQNYILVAYNYDSNAILVEAMPNREADTIVAGWKSIHSRLKLNSVATTQYILDNKCSATFKNTLSQKNIYLMNQCH